MSLQAGCAGTVSSYAVATHTKKQKEHDMFHKVYSKDKSGSLGGSELRRSLDAVQNAALSLANAQSITYSQISDSNFYTKYLSSNLVSS